VRRPTPAKVSRKAQRERFASAVGLLLGEEMVRRENGNQQEAKNELREFLPEEGRFVSTVLAGRGCPIDRIGEHDEAIMALRVVFARTASLPAASGVERARSSCFRGVVDASPAQRP